MREYIESRRPPAHMRKEINLSFRLKDQSVEIFEIRLLWNNPEKIIEESVAKATYVKSKKIWKLYWQRADLKEIKGSVTNRNANDFHLSPTPLFPVVYR